MYPRVGVLFFGHPPRIARYLYPLGVFGKLETMSVIWHGLRDRC